MQAAPEEPQKVPDLMAALEASLAAAKSGQSAAQARGRGPRRSHGNEAVPGTARAATTAKK